MDVPLPGRRRQPVRLRTTDGQRHAAHGPSDLRELLRGLADQEGPGRDGRQDEQYAEVRRLPDAEEDDVERHGYPGRPGRGRGQAQASAWKRYRAVRVRPGNRHANRARPARRAPPLAASDPGRQGRGG